MPPRKSNTLTEAELRLMKLLWARGESAVSDLVSAMPEGEALAYTSVLTTVRILEQKGYVRHRQEGRAFLYSPCVAEQEASRSEIRNTMQRFFGNSRERLLLSLLGDEELDAEELQRLKEAIAQAEKSGASEVADARGARPDGRVAAADTRAAGGSSGMDVRATGTMEAREGFARAGGRAAGRMDGGEGSR